MKKVLIISPTAFIPDWEGNRKRVGQIVQMFERRGFEVHFLFVRQADGDSARMSQALGGRFHELPNKRKPKWHQPWFLQTRVGRLLRAWSLCNIDVDAWYFDEIGALAQQIVEREGIDVVVAEYIFYSKALERLKGVVKVIDTHDIFADRYKVYLAVGRKPDWYSTDDPGERRALARADAVLAIQDEDGRHFRQYGHPAVYTMAYAPPAAALSPADPAAPLRLCFLGSANDINISALKTYLESIHPHLMAADLRFEVVVIGRICEVFKHARGTPGIEWKGRVEQLEPELAACDALINSVATGTGLPIKVLDALANGLHVLATDGGARGLPMREALKSVSVCEDAPAWVAAVRALAQRKAAGADLRSEALEDLAAIRSLVDQGEEAFFEDVQQRLR